jgi:uncharacterized membrane protein YfcA
MAKADFWLIYDMGRLEVDILSDIILIFIASFLAGIIGSMGLGGGSILILYLTLFAGVNQVTAQGINLIFFLPIGAVATVIYLRQKKIKYKTLIPFVLGGIPSTLIAGTLVNFIETNMLRKLFGAFVLIYGLLQIFKK